MPPKEASAAGSTSADFGAGAVQGLEHCDRELDGHVELPAELADVGEAHREHGLAADADLAAGRFDLLRGRDEFDGGVVGIGVNLNSIRRKIWSGLHFMAPQK